MSSVRRPLRETEVETLAAMTRQPLLERSPFIGWTVTVTVAESAGFIAPAVVGTVTTHLPWYGALPALLAAGAPSRAPFSAGHRHRCCGACCRACVGGAG